jgi:tyrosinase
VTQTRAGDYAWTTPFGYDYEPGSGEELIPRYAVASQKAKRARVMGNVQRREVFGAAPASAVVSLPSATVEAVRAGGQVMVANVTLNFPQMSHDAFMVILGGPDDLSHVDASSPHYLATIMMFGHRGAHGALTYTLPLTDKLRQAGTAQLLQADGSIRLRVVPMCGPDCHEHGHDHQHHDKVHGDAVELVAVSVESY